MKSSVLGEIIRGSFRDRARSVGRERCAHYGESSPSEQFPSSSHARKQQPAPGLDHPLPLFRRDAGGDGRLGAARGRWRTEVDVRGLNGHVFLSAQPTAKIGFPRYRIYFYNETSSAAKVALFVYRSRR
jgi:hypothetical protein